MFIKENNANDPNLSIGKMTIFMNTFYSNIIFKSVKESKTTGKLYIFFIFFFLKNINFNLILILN
ncbi:hypothetical protein NBO_17g0002 [Nosema bombycis CQ1]|uniref:Uncharacterized protein n=1 Tax=Nosema bombycis (strain CQ1 / CVCC 102059) TaxID=578461 RepID=R0MPB2_NOSB1|nr:hypothetical protein NBO_17g0002 [Nosema bombycis CQ1]|eukprot:EOB14713.1 hypothetical protein NBO_17g0002 [Nosema bombycis CQ1]